MNDGRTDPSVVSHINVLSSEWRHFYNRGMRSNAFKVKPRLYIICDAMASVGTDVWRTDITSPSGLLDPPVLESTGISFCHRASYGDGGGGAPWEETPVCAQFTTIGADNTVTTPIGWQVFGSTKDVSGLHCIVDFHFPTDADANNLDTMTLKIRSGASHFRTYRIWTRNLSSSRNKAGYVRATFTLSGYTTTGGTVNLAAIDRMDLGINHASGVDVTVNLIRILFIAPMGTADADNIYIPSFDDGLADHFSEAAYLSSYGIQGNFFVPVDNIGSAGKLTWDQLRIMQYAGHLICAHQALWPSDTDAQREKKVIRAAEKLREEGLPDGAFIFRPPGNIWPDETFYDNLSNQVLWQNARAIKSGAGSIFQLMTAGDLIGNDSYTTVFDLPLSADTQHTNNKTDKGILQTGWHQPATINGASVHDFDDWKNHIDTVGTDILAGTTDTMTLAGLMI